MNFSSVGDIKSLLQKYGAAPSKIMGQNFLIDEKALENIIAAAALDKKETVLEIGPGIGTLTRQLASRAGRVIAVEKDRMMVEILKETVKEFGNVEIIENDILKSDVELPTNYSIVANIPYYLTSVLIRKFLESPQKPRQMVLMLQKEVAERICAKAGDMSILAVSVQFYAAAEIVAKVPKSCFWPAPKVDSAIIKITPFKESRPIDETVFFSVVKAGFSAPRKQLANNLSTALAISKEKIGEWLAENNIDPKRRAETLDIEDWIRLASTLE